MIDLNLHIFFLQIVDMIFGAITRLGNEVSGTPLFHVCPYASTDTCTHGEEEILVTVTFLDSFISLY